MDGADGWSDVAAEWSELWGTVTRPLHREIISTTGIRPGTRVLDVGCGSGEFLAHLSDVGADPAGIDPAEGMLELARLHAPAADLQRASVERLPWPDATFDVVTAINSLQFADDTDDALAEIIRVTKPGGHIVIANWAEGALNDLDTIEQAIAHHRDEEMRPDGDLRLAGGLEQLLTDSNLVVVSSGLVECPLELPDEHALVRAVLFGEDPDAVAELTPVVLAAAPGPRLSNHLRYAVGQVATRG